MNTADVPAEVKCLRRLIGMRCSNVYDLSPKVFPFLFFFKLFSMKKKTFCNSVFAYVLIFLNLFAVYVQTYVLKLMNSSGVTESGESEKVLLLMESGVRLHTTAYLR